MGELVTPEQVAIRAGLPLPLSEQHRLGIEAAIQDALAAVAAYIGRSPFPARHVERGVYPDGAGGYMLKHEPVIQIEDVQAETDAHGFPTGRYTVTYRAGLDPEGDPDYGRILASYVAWAAANSPVVRRAAQQVPGARLHASVSVEGQSVTYEQTPSGQGAAGETPTLEWFDAYRHLVVHRQPGIAPHPIRSVPWWW